jgi:hypothetical protein
MKIINWIDSDKYCTVSERNLKNGDIIEFLTFESSQFVRNTNYNAYFDRQLSWDKYIILWIKDKRICFCKIGSNSSYSMDSIEFRDMSFQGHIRKSKEVEKMEDKKMQFITKEHAAVIRQLLKKKNEHLTYKNSTKPLELFFKVFTNYIADSAGQIPKDIKYFEVVCRISTTSNIPEVTVDGVEQYQLPRDHEWFPINLPNYTIPWRYLLSMDWPCNYDYTENNNIYLISPDLSNINNFSDISKELYNNLLEDNKVEFQNFKTKSEMVKQKEKPEIKKDTLPIKSEVKSKKIHRHQIEYLEDGTEKIHLPVNNPPKEKTGEVKRIPRKSKKILKSALEEEIKEKVKNLPIRPYNKPKWPRSPIIYNKHTPPTPYPFKKAKNQLNIGKVCIKHEDGKIERISRVSANEIITSNPSIVYTTKLEWRNYLQSLPTATPKAAVRAKANKAKGQQGSRLIETQIIKPKVATKYIEYEKVTKGGKTIKKRKLIPIEEPKLVDKKITVIKPVTTVEKIMVPVNVVNADGTRTTVLKERSKKNTTLVREQQTIKVVEKAPNKTIKWLNLEKDSRIAEIIRKQYEYSYEVEYVDNKDVSHTISNKTISVKRPNIEERIEKAFFLKQKDVLDIKAITKVSVATPIEIKTVVPNKSNKKTFKAVTTEIKLGSKESPTIKRGSIEIPINKVTTYKPIVIKKESKYKTPCAEFNYWNNSELVKSTIHAGYSDAIVTKLKSENEVWKKLYPKGEVLLSQGWRLIDRPTTRKWSFKPKIKNK